MSLFSFSLFVRKHSIMTEGQFVFKMMTGFVIFGISHFFSKGHLISNNNTTWSYKIMTGESLFVKKRNDRGQNVQVTHTTHMYYLVVQAGFYNNLIEFHLSVKKARFESGLERNRLLRAVT